MNCNVYRTPFSKKAMKQEINRCISEQVKELESNIVAMFLYAINRRWHYSAKTLEDFAKELQPLFLELENYYEFGKDDDRTLCYFHELEKIGLDTNKIEASLGLKGALK